MGTRGSLILLSEAEAMISFRSDQNPSLQTSEPQLAKAVRLMLHLDGALFGSRQRLADPPSF